METIELKNWEEFENIIKEEHDLTEKLREGIDVVPDIFFRGHAKKNWNLTTTLERYLERYGQDRESSWRRYYYILDRVKLVITSLTSAEYELPEPPENWSGWSLPGINFMIYLRHHGFPSPLLDWTKSPYIAAFFAFNEATKQDDVAIFSYRETLDDGSGGWTECPQIYSVNSNLPTHKRHYLQQCWYTHCLKEIKNNEDKIYCCHEEVEPDKDENIIKKYVIPSSEREKVMKKLDLMNINSFSLFDNEEGLMNMLAFRERRNF